MGDEASFTAWAVARQVTLLRTAVLLTGDRHRAEDLVQEALTKVAARWPRLAQGNPDAYARQVLVNDNISWWRRHRETPAGDHLPTRSVDDAAPSVDRRVLLEDALRRLPPRQRAVLVLRYFSDLGIEETADALRVSTGTVKSQTHAALRRLREAAPELAELIGGPR